MAPDLRAQMSFQLGAGAVPQIAEKLSEWLSFTGGRPRAWQQDLAELACSEFGWPEVARGVMQAATGRLSGLPLIPAS